VFVLFAVLFIFTGAQFLGLGLLGEYLGRVYHDVRARPRFFVERVVRSRAHEPQVAVKLRQAGPR
jgi:undecaprenyl-phosphate 4-deoxy-4-formamido-L-arabinose transferase